MYYTGLDPRAMKPVYVPRSAHDKALQRALLQWRRPEKRALVLEALHKAGREDLIGFGKKCLVRPSRFPEPGRPSAAGNVKNRAPARRDPPKKQKKR
jgi:hypothetical protein